ncbi:MAG: hypothetical protein K0Q51_310 [Rickettsiaceae bacterium]|jgi:uncharacterized protein (DUF983 family)|nr:hypothetical protein [Rickettsiaceae bacterium]
MIYFMAESKVSFATSLMRGLKSKCPSCGKGPLFEKFLKVAHSCSNCYLELFHHKADDMPAYIVILLVGHIVVPLFIWVMMRYELPDWAHLLIWIPATVFLSIILIQPVKGAIVAFQWHQGMHGFSNK